MIIDECCSRANSVSDSISSIFLSECVIESNYVSDSVNGINFVHSDNFYSDNKSSGNTTGFAGSVPTGSLDGGGNLDF